MPQSIASKIGTPFLAQRQRWQRTFQNLTKFLHLIKQGSIIRQFDRNVGHTSALWDKGYVRYPKARPEILDAARQLSANELVVIDEATLPIFAYLLNSVRSDVVCYLGPDVRVDNIYMNTIPASSEAFQSVSGSWHTDNVGHRLKLFFCIEGYGDVPTCYRPGSNRKPYRPSIRQHRRFFGSFDFSHRPDEIRLDHTTGDITLFDTNGQHRGVYDEHHRKRIVLQIEFADRRKSDSLVRLPVGPGRGFFLSKSIADTHARDLLLDPALFIPLSDEKYRYGRHA